MSGARAIAALAAAVLAIACSQPPPATGGSATSSGGTAGSARPSAATAEGWQEDFGLAQRSFSDTGESRFFILRPGFVMNLASRTGTLTISVLSETKRVGGVLTRVVEERETDNGQLIEVARNFFAIDQATGDVFYFGEEVDDYDRGRIVGHAGSWIAEGENRPGLIMSGAPRPGMRYYQEIAPRVAMDRAEVLSITDRCTTPSGPVDGCLRTRESTPLESGTEEKLYAPGIGIVRDKEMQLVSYGFRSGP